MPAFRTQILTAAAAVVAGSLPANGQVMECVTMSAAVNENCCPGATCTGAIPSVCPSTACADAYMPFYLECGAIIQAIQVSGLMETSNFASLYSDCVSVRGSTDPSTGKVVDTSVVGTTLFDLTSAGAATGWSTTIDGVMGGHSVGTFAESTDATCTGILMSGTIELTHGGFVDVRSPAVASSTFAGADGLRVCSKSTVDYGVGDGTGDLYKLKLSDGSRTSWQGDFHTTEAGDADFDLDDNCDGVISTVPFSQFWPSHYGQITGEAGTIDVTEISGIGFDVSFLTAAGGDNSELNHEACADDDESTTCVNLNPFGLCIQWVQVYTTVAGGSGQH